MCAEVFALWTSLCVMRQEKNAAELTNVLSEHFYSMNDVFSSFESKLNISS